MEKLIYARWASKVEVAEFISGIDRKNKRDYQKSLAYLENKKDVILTNYDLLQETYERIFEDNTAKRELMFYAYENNTCTCGSEPVFIETHGFWGCKNYLDKSVDHINFIGRDEQEMLEIVKNKTRLITDNWVTILKNKCGLPKSITIFSLYQFVINNGGFCLGERYEGVNVLHKLNNYRNAIKEGVVFEKEVAEILSKKHDNLFHQQAIKYQYQGRNQLYAIPDFIAVDDHDISIYECKLHGDLIDDRQRHKYMELVSFIMREKKIEKSLLFFYVYKHNGNLVFDQFKPE